jgi:hypothetical protein
MKIYIILANWGGQDQIEGCYTLKINAEERLSEVKDSADWAVIEEHDLIN